MRLENPLQLGALRVGDIVHQEPAVELDEVLPGKLVIRLAQVPYQQPPGPDEWMRVVGSVPLAHQPGTRWLYHTSADILGVLIARAAGQPLDVVLTERVLGPLGMDDTAFFVPDAERHRLGAVFGADPETGERNVYDPPDGQWATPPAFPGGGDGLVSTVDDLAAFGQMLLAGGEHRGRHLLSRPTVEAMTSNQLSPAQVAAGGPDPDGHQGWGLGVGVHLRRQGTTLSPGSYGWDGGLGTVWANDPAEDLVGVLLTNQMWTSPALPPSSTVVSRRENSLRPSAPAARISRWTGVVLLSKLKE